MESCACKLKEQGSREWLMGRMFSNSHLQVTLCSGKYLFIFVADDYKEIMEAVETIAAFIRKLNL